MSYKEFDQRQEDKALFKEAIKEWMDEKFAIFGKWSASGLAVLVLGALAYFILSFFPHGLQH